MTMEVLSKKSALVFCLLFGSVWSFQPQRAASTRSSASSQTSLQSDYLQSLAGSSFEPSSSHSFTTNPPPNPVAAPPPQFSLPATTPPNGQLEVMQGGDFFLHAPLSYFAIPNLVPKGPRANADVGQPHDSSLKLGQDGNLRSGSWWCAAGGWPSLKQRATTEIFYVIEGHGCLTDLDGCRHYFGPGDTVILPKGWSGRWDVLQDIHKVWFVHDHPTIVETSQPIRAQVVNYYMFNSDHLTQPEMREDAIHGSPESSTKLLYNLGPTKVGVWTCTPGSFPVSPRSTTECFHVLEGVFFLTNAVDGSAKRCSAGDTVILPKGWCGYWDIIEPVKKLWVEV